LCEVEGKKGYELKNRNMPTEQALGKGEAGLPGILKADGSTTTTRRLL